MDELNPHPLLIDLVLEILVDFMDYESQKAGRLVCTKWNNAILPEFVKLTSVNIKFDEERLLTMEEELISILIPTTEGLKSYQNVNIHSLKWLNSIPFRNWIAEYGKNFKTIILGKGEDDEVDDLEDVEEINLDDLKILLLDWCPNLIELRLPIPCCTQTAEALNSTRIMSRTGSPLEILLLGSSKWFKDDYEDIGIIARLVLQVAPNLTVLTMNSCQARGVDLLINNVKGSPTGDSLGNLTTLDLHNQVMNSNIVGQLAGMNFKNLRNLGIGDVGEVEDSVRFWTSVSNLLTNVSSSLEELSLGETYHGSLAVGNIPHMPKLKKFVNHHLRGWMLKNFDFLFSFPSLESCFLDSRCISSCGHIKGLFEAEPGESSIGLIRDPHMKLISLGLTCGIQDMFVFRNTIQCFPNLQSLHIKLVLSVTLPIQNCFDELVKLLKIERLWIHISMSIDDLEPIVQTYIPKFSGLKSLVIEGETYVFLKMDKCLHKLLETRSLLSVISRELLINDVALERLKKKFQENDTFVKISDN